MISQNDKKNKWAWFSPINVVFLAHLVVIGLVVAGLMPRGVVPFWTLVLAAYVLWASLEDSTTFFVRSIPFFIAIPITTGFDSLNMWRILSGLIFLKWFWQTNWLTKLKSHVTLTDDRIRMSYLIRSWFKNNRATTLLLFLLTLAILSIAQAPSHPLAIKSIIYFVNL